MGSLQDNNISNSVLRLSKNIQNGEIKGTYEIIIATVSVLKEIITNSKWSTAKELMNLIKTNGKYLIESFPVEASVGNMVRRILQIIREEYHLKLENTEVIDSIIPSQNSPECQESLHKILTSENDQVVDFNRILPSLQPALLEHINEFEVELETCSENITQQASKHIHSNEIVMTIGKSRLVEEFLKKAAETRTFDVIVVEGGPFLEGHQMAMSLTKAQIPTTLISDAAIFAMMSRVNKVIVGTHTVMANGGLRAITGSHTVALAANHYSVPVMVLLPLYKLSPLYMCSFTEQTFNKHVSPLRGVINGSNTALLEKIQSFNPVFDYVPADLVTLFISNSGGNAPSYVYRLLSELYHPDDYEL